MSGAHADSLSLSLERVEAKGGGMETRQGRTSQALEQGADGERTSPLLRGLTTGKLSEPSRSCI